MSRTAEIFFELVAAAILGWLALDADPYALGGIVPDSITRYVVYALILFIYVLIIFDLRIWLRKHGASIYQTTWGVLLIFALAHGIITFVIGRFCQVDVCTTNNPPVTTPTSASPTATFAIPTPTAEWSNAVLLVEQFHQAINSGEFEKAYEYEDPVYQTGTSLEDFIAFWYPYRVGYILYGCNSSQVELYRVFYDRSDYGYFYPIDDSKEVVHVWLVLNKNGEYKMLKSEVYPQVSESCEYALEFQAKDLDR